MYFTTCWGATLAPVSTQTRVTSPEEASWMASPPSFLPSFSALASLASIDTQMWQLQLINSITVLRITSVKGTTRQKINQMSIIFMSEVGGSSSIGNSLVYGIGEKVWWKISSFMLKNQHTYAEISADRSIPIPLQPPHLLYFDTLTLPDQKEKLTLSHEVSFVFFKFCIISGVK